MLDRRRTLLRKSNLTDAERDELASLSAQMSRLPTAVLPEDQKVVDALRKAAEEMGIPIPS